jgi:3'(2'), 5'-bisphosphate nucleotidase
MNDRELLQTAITAAILGGVEILEVYSHDFEVEFKEDKSPLTKADRLAHEAICSALQATGLPILSEEGKNIPFKVRKNWKKFWLVDPLDGTKEFVKRNGEFTVNIALVVDGKAIMGIILVPVSGLLYFASRPAGAFKIVLDGNKDIHPDLDKIFSNAEPLPLPVTPKTLTVVGSRSHLSPETNNFIQNLKKNDPDLDFISIGSSLKMCIVAEGKAHLYPRFGPTMEWDTAAGQAILEIAGGEVIIANSYKPVYYNKPDLLNPWFVAGRPR